MFGRRKRQYLISLAAASLSILSYSCRSRSELIESKLNAADARANPDSPFDFFSPTSWIPFANNQIMSQPLSGGFNIFQLDLADFGQIGGAFGISIRRQDEGVFLRTERWRAGVDIGPGALIQDAANASVPVAIRIAAGREVTYSRSFHSKREAILARAVNFTDLPLDADHALKMRVGDFVSIPSNMGITVGLEPTSTARAFAISAGVGAFWAGEFRINVYRQDEGFTRVKVLPSAARGIGAQAGVGARLDMFGYSPGKLINYDRQAERFFGLDFLNWSRNRVLAGERYAFDYVFNLNDASARVAFNAIMRNTLRLKSNFQSMSIFRGRVSADIVVADLTPAEYLSQLDQNRPAAARRVSRVFSGNDFYKEDSSAGKFGTKVFRFNHSKSLTSSKMHLDEGGDESYLTGLMLRSSYGQSSWISPLRENQTVLAEAVFASDPSFSQQIPRDVRFEFSFSQNDLKDQELGAIRDAQMVLLGSLYKSLGLNSPQAISGSQSHFASVTRFAIHPDMIDQLRNQVRRDANQAHGKTNQVISNVISRFRQSRGQIEFFREVTGAIARGEFRDLNAELGTPFLDLTMSLEHMSTADYLGEVFRLMSRSAAAELIVGGFLCDLSRAWQSPVYASVEESARGVETFNRSYGNDISAAYGERLERATFNLTHMGYEN
jgi:hypothetical protein